MNIGKEVQEFYNKTPFPDYDIERFTTREQLRINAEPFVEILDRSIPEDTSIIDIGCGTGQLVAYLSLRRESVWGIDFSQQSLNKATALKERLQLNSLTLKNMDIMDDLSPLPKFDCVLCFGVLHHTSDPERAFKNISSLLNKNGLLALGLYNTFGRLALKLRKLLLNTVYRGNQGIKQRFLKIQIKTLDDPERLRGWYKDQYEHPHESTHTLGQVLKWFKSSSIKYCQTIPPHGEYLSIKGVWRDERYPDPLTRMLRQLKWIYQTQREGGYFITFGVKT